MAARKTAIEFLPQEEWEKGTFGKLLKWALTVGRHIVIFTELIVILAFLSRFKFDRDLTDLNEKIKQKQAIIASSSQFEKEFRFLNKRLLTIEELRKTRLETNEVLNELAACVPIDVVIYDFDITNKQVSLTAVALSEGGLGGLIRNLKNSPRFENIALFQVSAGTEKEIGIKFQIRGDLVSL